MPLHINALLNVFIKHNPKIKPEAVDDCIRLMVWPQHHRKQLKDDFFSSRMVRPKERDQWPHLKGFASEMFPALDVLMYFLDVRLVDQEGLAWLASGSCWRGAVVGLDLEPCKQLGPCDSIVFHAIPLYSM